MTTYKTASGHYRVLPSETAEQQRIIRLTLSHSAKHPDIKKLFAIPNGGSRHKLEAKRLKAEGVVPGVPDLCLPVPRLGYHGLYVELKRELFGKGTKFGRWGKGQCARIRELRSDGYHATVACGCDHALQIILAYLSEDDSALDKYDRFEDLADD